VTQPPPDQQPTQHVPQQPPSLEKGAPGPAPQQPHQPHQPVPPVAPGPPQPQQQQWPVAPPPNPYGSGSGYPPYGSGPGPGPGPGPGYGGPVPPPSGGSGKAIAIIIGAIVLVVLLFCGGIITAIVVIAKNVEDAIDDWDPARTGGRDNPITVEVGESFEIDGVEYAQGWRVTPPASEYDGTSITGLEGTNDRSDESSKSAYLTFTFVAAGDLEVGQVSCSSSGSISYGNSEQLTCSGYDTIDQPYDHIEVSAS